jgi:hypothetical protein
LRSVGGNLGVLIAAAIFASFSDLNQYWVRLPLMNPTIRQELSRLGCLLESRTSERVGRLRGIPPSLRIERTEVKSYRYPVTEKEHQIV